MRQVYLDHVSHTPLLPEVREAMRLYQQDRLGNPSSLHRLGRKSAKALDEAREKVAHLVGAKADEIIFTSCGTEANNFAIKGICAANEKKGRHIIVSGIEHFSVLYAARRLERQGTRITRLSVDRNGLVNPNELRQAITPETVLVSIMHANGEIGTIEPIRELSRIAKEQGVLFHTDAISSVGTIPVSVEELGVDALTLAADQFYGPVGVATLYLRRGTKIIPFLDGGGQEDGKRSGTENLLAIIGMGKAAEMAHVQMPERMQHLSGLRDPLIEGLLAVEGVTLNGHPTERLPGHVSISVADVEGEALLLSLDMSGIFVGSGSACNSKAMKASHVLQAMGVPEKLAQGAIVMSLGIENQKEDIDYVLGVFPETVEKLRRLGTIAVRQEVR